jgi:hypothetical protein
VQTQITETSIQGDGIAKVQGFVIFVKNAEVVQPLDIRWPQDWLTKEIDQRLKKEEKFTLSSSS